MQPSSETQRKLLQEDVIRTKGALSALEQEELLPEIVLEEYKDHLSYAQNFLDGHYNFTFLIQGDPQTGKTTFLNVLLDDAIIPSSGHNAIIVVQYDDTWAIPALFTADLNEIYNSERQIFVINPGILRDTGIRGGVDIHSTLKHASKSVNPPSDQTVFVIKYRISWLKELIADNFVLNRIQFVDIEMPPEIDPNPKNLLRLEKITSSQDQGNIFITDGPNLFSIGTAAKYKELSENKESKEKSLLIINMIDKIAAKHHIQKIRKNESKLCLKLQKDSLQTIKDIFKEDEDTEEMRCEIFLQSFYEEQGIDQDKLTDGDVIYFGSALFAFNKILMCKYEECECDEDKIAFCALFDETNQNYPVYQSNKQNAAFRELDILQYHLEEESDLYQSNFEPVKKAISKIAKTEFARLGNELITKVEKTTLDIYTDCQMHLGIALSDHIEELKALRELIKDIIEERSKTFSKLEDNFKEKITNLLEVFLKEIQDINTDYFDVKNNHAKQLADKTKQLEEDVRGATGRFKRDYKNMETGYKEEISNLDRNSIIKDNKFMHFYIRNYLTLEYNKLEKENRSLVRVIEGLASCATATIISFINDGKMVTKITNLLRMFAKYFSNANTPDNFELKVKNSKSIFEETTSKLMIFHCEKEEKMRDKFEGHFIKYLSTTKNKSERLEKAEQIIREHFKPRANT